MTATLRIDPGALHAGVLSPPPSKSDAQRALVLGHVLGRREPAGLWNTAEADLPSDVRVVRRALAAFEGAGTPRVDCGDGGAPFRFLLAQAALRPVQTVFTGSRRLGARPHAPLMDALRTALGDAGLRIESGEPWPVVVTGINGRATAPEFVVDAAKSGQFVSSLLLAAAALVLREHRAWSVRTPGGVASEGYVALTVEWLRRAGFEVRSTGGVFDILGHREAPALPEPPGDWSSLGYLLLIAWAAGAQVEHVSLEAEHPDRVILAALEESGLGVDIGALTSVRGVARAGVQASGADSPDLLPTLAAFACVLPSESSFEHVEILRDKESDRLEGIIALVDAAGGRTELREGGTLIIHPPGRVRPFRFHSRGDHRMAMSAATLAVLGRVPLELEEPHVVAKSFPGFYDALRTVGCVVR